MPNTAQSTVGASHGHVPWIDAARGLCIVLVVMMHSTLGTGLAYGGEGWLHPVVAWAQPFRMPAFFMISGLLLGRAIDRDWITFLDRRVLHFAYFYTLWLIILVAARFLVSEGPLAVAGQVAFHLVSPFGPLWFLYALPFFFVAAKLLAGYPALLLALAVTMKVVPVSTGWNLIDVEASRYFLFFVSGYLFAAHVMRFAEFVGQHRTTAWSLLGLWAVLNAVAVSVAAPVLEAPLASSSIARFGLAGAGCAAIVAIAVLTCKRLPGLRTMGCNSLYIYVSFTLPMAASRCVLLELKLVTDIGLASLIVTTVALVTALTGFLLLRGTWMGFLYERPAWTHIRYRQVRTGLGRPVPAGTNGLA